MKSIIRLLQTKWTALAVGTLAYAATTWLCLEPQQQLAEAAQALHAAQSAKKQVPSGPSWTFQNAELDKLVLELKDEREALRQRAQQLSELEARLNAERQEICSATQTVYRLRAELDSVVTRVNEEEAVNLKKLARGYAAMSPEGASRILKEMDDEQLVKILATMKEAEFAPILESLGQGKQADARRAALISDRLRRTLLPAKKAATAAS